MKRILLFLIMSVLSYILSAQNVGPSKTCPTCHKSMAQCHYNGKHPKPKCSICGKELSQCLYNGNHPKPKCSICGKELSQCHYNGKHPKPKCSICGKELSQCRYNGKHPKPKCSICGKELSQCHYNGKHPKPKCSICGKELSQCRYNGKHPKPKCSICGKELSQCRYNGKHPKPKCSICGKELSQCQYDGNHQYINGHEWVDLGLSVKWATCNVGANSPEDYGGYYAWGETREKSNYDWSNCFDCLDSEGKVWGIYKLDGKTVITPTSGHDTARENWGGTWRMPTDAENDELFKKCKWTWTNLNGHKGYFITGPNGNSIFLPAAGWRGGTILYVVGMNGYYWSSTLSSSYSGYARGLYFYDSTHDTGDYYRRYGQGVRPVTE